MPPHSAARLRFRVTRPGWIYLILTTAFGVQSVQAGNNLVFLIFTLMAGFWLSLMVATAAMVLRLQASRRLPTAGCAGESLNYPLEIRHAGRFCAAYYVQISDQHSLAESTVSTSNIVQLKPGEKLILPATVDAPKRGWFFFYYMEAHAEFPFGLCAARSSIGAHQRLPIYPERWAFQKPPLLPGVDDIGADPAAGSSIDGMDFLGLREFHPGDHPRSVHWRALGRMPDLMLVRLFETQHDHSITLFLDSFFPADEEERCRQAFEDNICLALALIEQFLASRHEVVFAGFSDVPRLFPIMADSPVLTDLRLWLATLEPERKRSLRELFDRVRVAPGSRAILLALPRPTPALPPNCLRVSSDQLKPFLKKKNALKTPASPKPAASP